MDLKYTFNEDAENYDRYRPTYPTELFRDTLNYAELSKNDQAVEIGIGTGQSTFPFLKYGLKVLAIEIGANLADYVKTKYQCYSEFKVLNEDFLESSILNKSIQLVYSSTAFHWLDQEKAFKKVHGILSEGGTLALFWNHPYVNRKDDPLHQKIRAIYKKYKPNDQHDIKEFDGHTCAGYCQVIKSFGFKEAEFKLYFQTRKMNADAYIGLLNTYSDHRSLEKEIKVELEKAIHQAILNNHNQIMIYDTIDLYLAKK